MEKTMTAIRLLSDRINWKVATMSLILILLFVWLGLNYRQLYSVWAIRSETQRLVKLAVDPAGKASNLAAVEDRFGGKLSSDFWKFTTINGGGKVSTGTQWHSAALLVDDTLKIRHFPDPSFQNESANLHPPGPEQYNNVTLIGGNGFTPSPTHDIVLKFTARVDEKFYGTAGVVFQMDGTLQKDGFFVKPFNMFGFSIAGKESSIMGINGPLCYLALNRVPVQVEALRADPQSFHAYELRLRWVSQTEWLGTTKVDEETQCQIAMPALGPVEVHVWSDNTLVHYQPRRWWEIAPSMDLKYQDGGEKQFDVGQIEIFEEAR
jgi:hypothetical protein